MQSHSRARIRCTAFTAPQPLSLHTFALPLLSEDPPTTVRKRPAACRCRLTMNRPAVTRRLFLATSLSSIMVVPTVLFAGSGPPAGLEGQVEPYKDIAKGFSLWRPSGWNEFEGAVDMYDVKWQDLVEPFEAVSVLVVDGAQASTVSDLGGLQRVGEKLAKSRGGTLLDATEREGDQGDKMYLFEMKKANSRLLTLLTVNKKKLYSVNATCSEDRWKRREQLLRGVVNSFSPRL